jgi:hypothetical protein
VFVTLGVMARKRVVRYLRLAVLPLIAFSVLLAGFLPAHQSSHHAAMAGSSAVTTHEHEHSSKPAAGHEATSHSHASVRQAQALSGHHDDGQVPFCHSGTTGAYVLPARCALPDWDELLAGVALALAGGLVVVAARAASMGQAWRSWPSRPWWRLSGASLLTAVCVSRT